MKTPDAPKSAPVEQKTAPAEIKIAPIEIKPAPIEAPKQSLASIAKAPEPQKVFSFPSSTPEPVQAAAAMEEPEDASESTDSYDMMADYLVGGNKAQDNISKPS